MNAKNSCAHLILAAFLLSACGSVPLTSVDSSSASLSTLNQGILPGSKGERLPILPGSKGERLPVLQVEMILPQAAFGRNNFMLTSLADDVRQELESWQVFMNDAAVEVEWLEIRPLNDSLQVTFRAQTQAASASSFFSTTVYNQAHLLKAAALVPVPLEEAWRTELSLTSTAVWLAAEKRQQAKNAPLEDITVEEVTEIEEDPSVKEIAEDLQAAFQRKKGDTDVRETESLGSRLQGLLEALFKRFGKSMPSRMQSPTGDMDKQHAEKHRHDQKETDSSGKKPERLDAKESDFKDKSLAKSPSKPQKK